jgi:uncharacterized membrane protein YuzA (DUF378 family)
MEDPPMKALNLATLVLVIIGGLNWGLVGLMEFDLVAALFGAGSLVTNLVYVIVGLAALWQIVPLIRSVRIGEVRSEAALHH